MLVLIEGIDRVGKTTLARKLEERGFIYLKDSFELENPHNLKFKDYSIGKCDTSLSFIKQLLDKGFNVVMDRMHLTEYVYGVADREGEVNTVQVFEIDEELAKLDSLLIYMQPTNLLEACKRADKDLLEHNTLFEYIYEISSMRKMKSTFHSIDLIIDLITDKAGLWDFYFASPFFNQEQVEREERLKTHLRRLGYRVYSPKESCNLNAKASKEDRQQVFDDNCHAIRRSKAVFAISDGKDMGTIWEAGFAYGIKKPILYYAETLGENQFNLMLAQSGKGVFRSVLDLTTVRIDACLNSVGETFEGDIE